VSALGKRRDFLAPVLLAVALALFWLFYPDICSIDLDSPTFDEGMYITQGIYILHNDDYSLAIQHPPLSKILIALPTTGMDLELPSPEQVVETNVAGDRGDPILDSYVENYPPDQLARNPYYIGYHMLYTCNLWDMPSLFLKCRRAVQLMHYILVFLLFLLVRKIFSSDAAIVAACIAFFDPNMVAHGHLCTTDMPAALFSVLSLFIFVHVLDSEKPKPAMILLWGISLALMAATKFSTLIIIFTQVVIFLWTFRKDIRGALINLLGAAVIAIIVCFIIGGYSFSPYSLALKQLLVSLGKGRPSYLLGQYSQSGFPLYYFATLLFKMPTALILMLLGGIGILFKLKAHDPQSHLIKVLWLIPVVFLISTVIFHGNNLGFRHLLVVYPFLVAMAASIFPRVPKLTGMTGVGIILLLFILLESIPAMNNSIPFFNLPGRKAAYEGKLLADSNIDWGQDLSRLGEFCRRNRIKHLRLRYFGTADPFVHLGDIPGLTLDIMGTEYNEDPVPPGWYAISMQKLLGVRKTAKLSGEAGSGLQWLRDMGPAGRAGGSILIYHVE
jgi:hypothetical protein